MAKGKSNPEIDPRTVFERYVFSADSWTGSPLAFAG
jgi:hypothetical protein